MQHVAVAQLLLADDVGEVGRNAGQTVHREQLLVIVGMDGRFAMVGGFHSGHAVHVVRMPVRQEDALAREAGAIQRVEKPRML